MGKFVISKDKSGQFCFSLKAANGQEILSSEAYKTKAACENGVAPVKRNALNDALYERKKAKNGNEYFKLKATNGQVIGTSEMYKSVSATENGITSVRKNAPEAPTEDIS